ncbi:MAG: hypothetical protein KDJ99_23045 [Candidatus Competibacteraceae bacterium]|nr:hypothetical protein [Candidatus Competibacteraceae bacterium]
MTQFCTIANRPLTSRAGILTGIAIAFLAGSLSAPAQAADPWTSITSYRKTGTTQGKFQNKNQTTGTYSDKITVYKLDDASYDQGDWYRIDFEMVSAISKYRKGDGICGWWTDQVKVAFDLTTSGGEIWELGPQTTQGSSTTSFSLGSSLASVGPRVSASYSVTQTVPDAGIKLNRNTVNETAIWTARLRGCKDIGSPVSYKGASKVAKSTFTLQPSIVVKVPEAKRLDFKTTVGTQNTSFTHKKGRYTVGNGLKTYQTDYSFKHVAYCTSGSCRVLLK